jgi:hypothetical protein
MLTRILQSIAKKTKRFLIIWAIILITNQIFIFGACFALYCLAAALPHTFAVAALLNFFAFRNESDGEKPLRFSMLSITQSMKVAAKIFWVIIGILVLFALWDKHRNTADDTVEVRAHDETVGNTDPHRIDEPEDEPGRNNVLASGPVAGQPAPAPESMFQNSDRGESYGTNACNDPINWTNARKYIGQTVTIEGPFLEAKRRVDVAGSPMWIDSGARYPSKERLSLIIWGEHMSKFDAGQLDPAYWFQTVNDDMDWAVICVTGKVNEYKGVVQIELQDPSQMLIYSGYSYSH